MTFLHYSIKTFSALLLASLISACSESSTVNTLTDNAIHTPPDTTSSISNNIDITDATLDTDATNEVTPTTGATKDTSTTDEGTTSTDDTAATTSFTPNTDIKIIWAAPFERENNQPMALSEIAGYKIYIGLAQGEYLGTVDITNALTNDFTFHNFPAGIYYFAITTYDTEGRESLFSTEIKIVV